MSAVSQQHQAELRKRLWEMANNLRGQMEASEFKNYILGLIFYRYLSEKVETTVEALLADDETQTYAEVWKDEETRNALVAELVETIGYVIEPEFLFSTMVAEINKGEEKGNFDIELLQKGTKRLVESTRGEDSQDDFDNLFDDMDLNSSKLGRDVTSRSKLIAKIMVNIKDIPFLHDDVEIDVLGDTYEYMISKFAATAGKSAGEFYTPQQVSKILSKIVTAGKTRLKSVYDPTCGSGSLLLRVAREVEVGSYYGQELTSTTYNLARMNMMLHGVDYDRFDIKNANTLTEPQHLGQKFEAIVANPPYSAQWSADDSFLTDERFSDYGKLAPKSKADFAFVQHMIHHLDDNGTMAVVLPHGVLFRGAAEGVIRKHLIEGHNYLDAVIGLPANIFFGTSIPTCILVFKKCRKDNDKVLFIDASNEFEKGKNSNSLRNSDVDTIVDIYVNRKEVTKYSRLVARNSISDNDYNLNIPRYIDSSSTEESIDLYHVRDALQKNDEAEKSISEKIEFLRGSLKELVPTSKFAKKIYEEIIETAPTLEMAIMVYDRQGLDILLYDGENVESSFFEYYPVEAHHFQESFKDLFDYLKVESYVIQIRKDRTGEIAYGVNVREAIWTPIEKISELLEEKPDTQKYENKLKMIFSGLDESYNKHEVKW